MNPAPRDSFASSIPDALRMERMQRMFAAERAVLVEDYEHFSGVKITPPEARPLSKAGRKSATLRGPQSQEPS